MTEKTSLSENTPLVVSKKIQDYSANGNASRELQNSAKELKRSLGYIQAFAYVVGILLGSGILVSPSFVAKETSSMGVAIVIWIVSGIVCLLGALCFCELASIFQKAGGEYIFIKEIYGDVLSFFTIWAQMLVIFPAGYAFLAATIGQYLVAPLYDTSSEVGEWLVKVVAGMVLLISFLINCASVDFVGKTQVIFTVIQSLTVMFICAAGVWQVCLGKTQNYEHMFENTKEFDPRGLSLAFYDSLWAYDGWGYICIITEEVKNPSRNLPLSLMTGIPFVTICYVLINLAFMSALTQAEIARSPVVAAVFIGKLLGKNAAIVVSIAAAISCFSCLNASKCVSARALLSASREGHLPEPLSYIHRTRRTPILALLFQLFLTVVWAFAIGGELQTFVTYFSFAVWLTYGLALLGLIIIRVRHPHLQRSFKVPIAIPVFVSLVSVYLVTAPFAKQPIQSSVCVAAMVTAFPVYYIFIHDHKVFPPWLTNLKKQLYTKILLHSGLVQCIFVEAGNTINHPQDVDNETNF